MNYPRLSFAALFPVLFVQNVQAQDLDPRAYVRAPVHMTFLVAGFGYSHGGVLTDPTLPIKDLQADIETPSLGTGHVFGLLGKTAQVTVAVPYSWAQLSGTLASGSASTERAGFGDMRLRLSVLLFGGNAASAADLAKAEHHTIVGTSISVVAPTGEYSSDKLINLGTSRWAFKPELALSQPVGRRWLIDVYSAIWLFTENNSFYPGSSIRSQNPLGAFQAHFSFNFQPNLWAAIDVTYYTGGNSAVNGKEMDDRQSNTRVGATVVLPVGKLHSVKLAYSTGAIVRYGANFTSLSFGWQTLIMPRPKKAGS